MTDSNNRRVRDPVHGLIVFEDEPVDRLAWLLIDTPEFQRLRRIRQLGVSEFTFPGAVHTRFAHSIGVFHNARTLVKIIEREIKRNAQSPDAQRAEVAVIAALLHDLGHGPFSHTFERVQEHRGVKKRHEKWTAEIIRNPDGRIRPLLDAHRPGFGEEVATLLELDEPTDIYHAVVSSSFDADRLDYLRRDKLMTGTGAGAIDFDWLMDNVRVAEVDIGVPDADDEPVKKVATFCLAAKALPAAEQFLLARYTLHEQVYFHKTTRCVEAMLRKLLARVATLVAGGTAGQTGLASRHPLVAFFAKDGETVPNYLALDDALILGSFDAMSEAGDSEVADLASRMRERRLYKTYDLAELGHDAGRQRQKLRKIKGDFKDEIEAGTAIIDEDAAIGIYSEIGGDEERMHKKLHIMDGARPKEISEVSKVIKALEYKEQFTRVFFRDTADRDRARGRASQ